MAGAMEFNDSADHSSGLNDNIFMGGASQGPIFNFGGASVAFPDSEAFHERSVFSGVDNNSVMMIVAAVAVVGVAFVVGGKV